MRGGGIFSSEFGSLSGEPVLDTKKQMACADDCGAKYPNDLVNYNICYSQCWASAYVPDSSTPSTTIPGTTPPTTPGTTTSSSKCTDACSQYPVFSLDFVKCQAACAGIGGDATPQPGGVIPGGTPATTTPVPGSTASGTSPWLIVGVLGALGLGAYYMFGKKKAMTPNRCR